MSECTHDCSTCSQKCDKEKSPYAALNQFSSVGRVIAVGSGKGGVGKSSVTALLAVMMARCGYKVGILDADITGPSIPKAFGITRKARGSEMGILPEETHMGIKVMSINLLLEDETQPVVWRGPVLGGAVTQFWTDVAWGMLDVLFIDMPPGTGDVPLTVYQSLPVDGAVIVSTPQSLVQMVVSKAHKMTEMLNIPTLGLVENMSYITCPDCGKKYELFGKSRKDDIAKQYNIPLTAGLPIDPKLAGSVDKGLLELFEGDWLDQIADAIQDLEPKAHL